MSRTFGGLFMYDASQLNFTGTATYTRNGAGDVSLNQGSSLTVQYQMGLADVKRPYLTFPAFPGQGSTTSGVLLTSNENQEVFGTAAGGPSNPFGGSAAGVNFFGTPGVPWGVSIIDVFALYAVGTLALTSATITLYRNVYAENVALATTSVVTSAAGATATTSAANACHVFKVSLTQPLVYETTDFSDLLLELVLVTPATSTARVYALGMHAGVEYS